MTPLRLRYQTLEFGIHDLHVRSLRDRSQFSDDDGAAEQLGICSAAWPFFGIVWASGQILAEHMAGFDIGGKRILEVGCGIALASLVLNQRQANITTTDYHPEVESFLKENVKLNNGARIPFVRTGWGDAISELGEFDLVIGSDLLYERDHVDLLSRFINQHTKPQCEVILVDPGRGNHARFSKKMVSLGYAHTQAPPVNADIVSPAFRGQILSYTR